MSTDSLPPAGSEARQYWLGEWTTAPLTAESAAALCRKAHTRREQLASYPLDKILRLLDAVRGRFKDPNDPVRRSALDALPGHTGFSKQMVLRGLEALHWTFDPDLLRRKVETELAVPRGETRLTYEPLGVVLHVLAGNVFVGAAGSLAEGLITRNVNVLKMSSSETVFLPLLVEAIRACDPDGVVSSSLAVVAYRSAQQEVMAAFKQAVDGLVVWGGEEAVKAYRADLPARCRLVVFGPKLSVAVVTRKGLAEVGVDEVARRLAGDVSIWDQNACTAPQVCYVEGRAEAGQLVDALPQPLEALAASLPPGELDMDTAVEIRKLRTVFEIAEPKGQGALRESARGLDWTVVLDPDPTLEPSPLHRTLRVVPVDKVQDVLPQLALLRGYVQTVGLVAAAPEHTALCDDLARAGALRLMPLGKMASGEIDDPHDGQYDLPQLSHLVFSRAAPGAPDPLWSLGAEARAQLVDQRLRRLIDVARRSRYYGEKLAGLTVETAHDLPKLPILRREDLESNMPPASDGLSTGPWQGGYITRSGGSTGEPKYSIYDGPDWDRMIDHAVDVFRALGLAPTDRLANCMMPGDLYGSFVSFDHVNHRLGVATFAFGISASPATFAQVWRKFGINALQGIPPHFMPFLRDAKQLEPALTLEKVVFAGAPLSPSDDEWLRRELKVARIASIIGANDGGQLAYQCAAQRGAMHHVADEFNTLEIVDDDGRPLPDGESGRVLITSLLKLAFPLIRYDIGDRGRIVPGTCPCGRSARVLEYLGRADDGLRVGLMGVRFRDFSEALRAFPVSALQLAARSVDGRDLIELRVETPDTSASLPEQLRSAVVAAMPTLARRLEDGNLAGLVVKLFAPGQLPRNPRSSKVKTIVDERS